MWSYRGRHFFTAVGNFVGLFIDYFQITGIKKDWKVFPRAGFCHVDTFGEIKFSELKCFVILMSVSFTLYARMEQRKKVWDRYCAIIVLSVYFLLRHNKRKMWKKSISLRALMSFSSILCFLFCFVFSCHLFFCLVPKRFSPLHCEQNCIGHRHDILVHEGFVDKCGRHQKHWTAADEFRCFSFWKAVRSLLTSGTSCC